jgi:hypothetical protein
MTEPMPCYVGDVGDKLQPRNVMAAFDEERSELAGATANFEDATAMGRNKGRDFGTGLLVVSCRAVVCLDARAGRHGGPSVDRKRI